MSLLEIRNLTIDFPGWFTPVEGLDLTLDSGEVLGLVGESGSGKSLSALALMGLAPPAARVTADRMEFAGIDLLSLSEAGRRKLLGKDIAMIFQEPTASLNPCFTIGFQIEEVIAAHDGASRAERKRRVTDLLAQVGFDEPQLQARSYPHQLSGGMNQRAVIAMALACRPKLLIADEPTASLDSTIQAQIVGLLAELQHRHRMAMLLISHDIALVAATAARIQVMYAGQAMEEGDAAGLVAAPRHPYSAALLAALPERATQARRLPAIPGTVPRPDERPGGCLFHPRCRFAFADCVATRPGYEDAVRCHTPLDAAGRPLGHPGPQALLHPQLSDVPE
jgi:dipeptide transport system ATP-binding protein